ncbi:hypothetical protein [Methylocella sp.]|uniref:hypothetical protein n=1 Tax=Methylocella sp. TaxID=1978226 RepID=UPI0035AF5133
MHLDDVARCPAPQDGNARHASAAKGKAKFDAQIVAIAAVESATVIYSDDDHIRKAAGSRFEVKGITDLELPPEDAQVSFRFETPSANEDDEPLEE